MGGCAGRDCVLSSLWLKRSALSCFNVRQWRVKSSAGSVRCPVCSRAVLGPQEPSLPRLWRLHQCWLWGDPCGVLCPPGCPAPSLPGRTSLLLGAWCQSQHSQGEQSYLQWDPTEWEARCVQAVTGCSLEASLSRTPGCAWSILQLLAYYQLI